jgi:hypothetical protein
LSRGKSKKNREKPRKIKGFPRFFNKRGNVDEKMSKNRAKSRNIREKAEKEKDGETVLNSYVILDIVGVKTKP